MIWWRGVLVVMMACQLNVAQAEEAPPAVTRETVRALIQRFEFGGQLQQMMAAIVQQTQTTLPQVANDWIDQRPYWDYEKKQQRRAQLKQEQAKLAQAFADEVKQLDLSDVMERNLLAVSGNYVSESDLKAMLETGKAAEMFSSTPLPAMLSEAMQRTLKQVMPMIAATRDRVIEQQLN
ncbi:hypothetical protein [Chitinivorax sp. B]|uniref:hypothetical protein n=1 Tax=Chitinivorax sp. B TaxID=2502235 RepID=UPI0010F7F882|nr:hypothetical protein [Chitinivorax sp. B]